MLEREFIEQFIREREKNGFIDYVGIECVECYDGHAVGKIKVKSELLNPYGGVHGGCLFTLADTIAGIAAMTRGSYVTTLSSSIQFLNAAKDTEALVAEASEVKNGKNISVYDVIVYDDNRKKIAKATLDYYKLEPIKL